MTDFVTGTLVESTFSGFDPRSPAERFLTVATAIGKNVKIFDYGITTAMPISGAIPIGGTYHFLVSLIMENIEVAPFLAPTPLPWKGPARIEVWAGTVVDTNWIAPQQEYLCVVDNITQFTSILVETDIGLVITSQKATNQLSLRPGDRLRWRQLRFDLMAIW